MKENRLNLSLRSGYAIHLTGAGIICWVFFTIYLLRLDEVAGMVVDDAWYIMLGKAMADGHGFTLINSPSAGIRPFIPPGFPAILSLVFLVRPDFPDNIPILKSISIAAMFGVGVLTFIYFYRYRELPFGISLGIASATVFYPGLVFFATSTVMSECVFMLLMMVSMVLIERGVSQKGRTWIFILSGAVAVSFAFLARPAAVGIVVAAIIYLMKERLLRKAILFLFIIAIFIGPWLVYSKIYEPTPDQRAEVGSNIVRPYSEQFRHRVAGIPSSGSITPAELPGRVIGNLGEISKYDMGAVPFYIFYRAIEPGQTIKIGLTGIAVSLIITILAVIGFCRISYKRITLAEIALPLTLMTSLVWGWEQFRFLLPLMPFLIFYMLMGIYSITHVLLRKSERAVSVAWRTVAVFVWAITLLNLYTNIIYIKKQYDPAFERRLTWHSAYSENLELFKYVSESLPKTVVVATNNPALVYLHTGHKTVAADDPGGLWMVWEKLGVRYLVRTSPYPVPPPGIVEKQYEMIYRQRGRLGLRVIDLGPPGSRPGWGW